MPTKKRITVPGAIAHVMSRGINGANISCDEVDREYFLDQCSESLQRTGYLCYGWVLMNNHYHLVVRCSEQPLDSLMRVINARYAKYFNMKYRRTGYLFQGRFKSIITQDQGYLEALIRYVHLNPIRAGICRDIGDLDKYRWCGHGVLLGYFKNSFQTTASVLRYFGTTKPSARKRYRQFIEEGIEIVGKGWLVDSVRESNRGVDKKDKPGCWVIGDHEFVSSVMEKNKQYLRVRSILRERWSIEEVFEYIAKAYNLKPENLKKRSRLTGISECRKRGAYLCCRIIGYSLEKVAEYLKISSPAVSWALHGGEELIKKDDVDKFINLTPG